MFNCKELYKLQVRLPSLILLIAAPQDRGIFPSQSWEVRNLMMMIVIIIIIIIETVPKCTCVQNTFINKCTLMRQNAPSRSRGQQCVWQCDSTNSSANVCNGGSGTFRLTSLSVYAIPPVATYRQYSSYIIPCHIRRSKFIRWAWRLQSDDVRILPSEGAERNAHVMAAIERPEWESVARDWCVRACSFVIQPVQI